MLDFIGTVATTTLMVFAVNAVIVFMDISRPAKLMLALVGGGWIGLAAAAGAAGMVLAAWGFTIEGRRVLLHMMAGSKEDAETVTAFFENMKMRGLNDPLLVTSDGAPGIVKAIEICFPRAARQRCLAHRMRNLAAKVPDDVWPDFKVRAQAAYQAPSRAIARELAAGVVADYGRKYDSAVACFMDDFEACIAHLRFPVTHRRAIRTTDEMDKRFFVTSQIRGDLLQVCSLV